MKGVKRMKKFGKFIATLAGVGAVCPEHITLLKKFFLKIHMKTLTLMTMMTI